ASGIYSTAANLCQGTYTITVTDDSGNGNSSTKNVIVGGPSVIGFSASLIGDPNCDLSCAGSIDLTATGTEVGNPNVTYSTTKSSDGGAKSMVDGNCTADAYYIDFIPSLPYTNPDEDAILSICVSFTHPNPADLKFGVTVINAAGNYKYLDLVLPGDIPAGANITNACFTRDATESISTGTAPYTGNWKPIDNFTKVNYPLANVLANDLWYLAAWDCVMNGQKGTIDYFEVTFVTATNSTTTYAWSNGDTTEDISGLCPGTYTITVTDNVGCTDSEEVVVPCTLGIEEEEGVPDRLIQESPGLFRIQTSKDVKSVEVYSIDGKKVFNEDGNVSVIDLSKERAGVYIAKVNTDGGNFTQKVVVTD
ncbi:MAG: T9SS type A sorting domain-containing protein, partial [Bacteroidetes bacterium]|nr:T9SS type A sorting domain-containing protein [Bacteroidota bacterium]